MTHPGEFYKKRKNFFPWKEKKYWDFAEDGQGMIGYVSQIWYQLNSHKEQNRFPIHGGSLWKMDLQLQWPKNIGFRAMATCSY